VGSTEHDAIQAQLRLVRDPEQPQPAPIYANQMNVTYTPEDFTFHFGWYAIPPLAEPPADGTLTVAVESMARVVLPLNLIPNLVALLQRQISAYEENFGPLPEHPNRPPWMRGEEE
jgi:hypothetical protein